MKYKVIGWTSMDSDIEEVDSTYASYNAIIDYLYEKKYCFTGTSHQFHPLGVPVLNDGKKRTYSERTWGKLMNKVHNGNDYMVYAYAFYDENLVDVFPDESEEIKKDDIIVDNNISEDYLVNDYLSKDNNYIYLSKNDKFRYLDKGDYLIIDNNRYIVKDVEYGYYYDDKYITEEEIAKINNYEAIIKAPKVIIVTI